MLISILNPSTETLFVAAILLVLAIIPVRRGPVDGPLPRFATSELKGLAILMVILSHIGYFLVNNNAFLRPLSDHAGLGVDLFFILSGYGLTASAIARPIGILDFYRKRLSKIYLPVAITVALWLILDFFILHRTYPFWLDIKNLFGFFPEADLYHDVNSPLWFITLLLFYYLIFPLVLSKKHPFLSALGLGLFGYVVTLYSWVNFLPITPGVAGLYTLHLISFPTGIGLATIVNQPPTWLKKITTKIHAALAQWHLINFGRWLGMACCAGLLTYTLRYTNVGSGWQLEEGTTIISALALIGIFMLKRIEFRNLALFGFYSFEIYLLHWPLIYRYDILYYHLSAGEATVAYLVLLLALAYLYRLVLDWIIKIVLRENRPGPLA